MNPFTLANPLSLALKAKIAVGALLGVALIAALLYGWHRSVVNSESGLAAEKATSATEKRLTKAYQQALDKSKEEGALREDALRLSFTTALGVRDEKLRNVNVDLGNALRMLNDRNDRPASAPNVPAVASTPEGCTGAGLYRADAEVLVWFAASAASVAIDRDFCYQQLNDQFRIVNEPPKP